MSDMAIPEDIPRDVWKYAESVEKVWRDLPPREAVERHARRILAERTLVRVHPENVGTEPVFP